MWGLQEPQLLCEQPPSSPPARPWRGASGHCVLRLYEGGISSSLLPACLGRGGRGCRAGAAIIRGSLSQTTPGQVPVRGVSAEEGGKSTFSLPEVDNLPISPPPPRPELALRGRVIEPLSQMRKLRIEKAK